MSYDLCLFTPGKGVDPREIIDGAAEANPGPRNPKAEALKQSVAAALVAHDGRLALASQDFAKIAELHKVTPAEAYVRFRELQLDDQSNPASGISITLFDDSAILSIPYWHKGEAARRVLAQAWDYIGIVCKACGYEVYDPHLDAVIDVNAFDKVLSSYAGATARMEERIGRTPQKKPWWKFW